MPAFMSDPDFEPQPLEPDPGEPFDTPPDPIFDPVEPDTTIVP